MGCRRSAAGVLVFVVQLTLAVTAPDAQERVRIDGQVQWVAATRMQVMTGGGSVAVDLRQADQAAHRGLRAGERVSVEGSSPTTAAASSRVRSGASRTSLGAKPPDGACALRPSSGRIGPRSD